MNIIIVGAGEVGRHLAENLSGNAHNIIIVEKSAALCAELNEKLDVRVVQGSGAHVRTLEEAMIAECDILLALTSDDNANLVAASIGAKLGAKRTICRVHAGVQRDEWLFDFKQHFGTDYIFSAERLAAIELAKFIRSPDSLLVEELAKGRIELQQLEVCESCKAAAHSLSELSLPPRVRIGLVRRGTHIFIPKASDVLQPADLITLFGEPKKLSSVIPLFRTVERGAKQMPGVVIFGGTECGMALAQMLEGGGYKVRIFEKDKKRCAKLAELFQQASIIHADASSLPHLREEQVGEADFFVAVSDDDEDNVMTCIQAHHLGTKHCLTLIHRSDYASAIQRSGKELGILGAVSPRETTRRDLMRFMTTDHHRTALALGGGSEVIESTIHAHSPLAGKMVSEVDWPDGSGLVALLHKQHAAVPAADDIFQSEDTIYAIVSEKSKKAFLKLLGS